MGITDYCIYPKKQLRGLPRIGGTKNPRMKEIVALKPDVVFANQEENTPAVVNALRAAGLQVIVNFPQTVDQALADLRAIAALFQSAEAAHRVEDLAAAVAAARRQARDSLRTFCPIWQDLDSAGTPWWMTFNQYTFSHDLLGLCGFANVFAERERRYPLAADLGQGMARDTLGRDTRYPRVTLEEIISLAPELILLPSEPFAFGQTDADRLADLLAGTPAARNEQIHLVDGSVVTWPGTRIGRAVAELPLLLPARLS